MNDQLSMFAPNTVVIESIPNLGCRVGETVYADVDGQRRIVRINAIGHRFANVSYRATSTAWIRERIETTVSIDTLCRSELMS